MEPDDDLNVIVKRNGWSVWNIESGYCPYGHPLEDCRLVRVRKDGRVFNVCTIKDKMRKLAYKSKNYTEVPVRYAPPPFSRTGSNEHSGDSKRAHIVFVCGHTTEYDRRTIVANYDNYPGALYCHRCFEFKEVHSVSSRIPGAGCYIYRQLEVSEK